MAKIGLDLRFWRASTGGISRYSRNLLDGLLKIDNETEYTAIITKEDEPEFDLKADNLKTLVVPYQYYGYGEQLKLGRLLTQQNFDLVHFTHFSHPVFYRRPFVVTIHDLIQYLFPTGGQRKSRIRKIAYRTVIKHCRRAEKVIVPSTSTKNDLIKMFKFKEDKIIVTPEGAQSTFHSHSSREIINVKERLGLPDRYLLFVSRWTSYKGLPTLIGAYQRLTHRYPDLGLVICGKPESNQPEVEKLVRSAQATNNKIVTPGFVSDEELSLIYSAASVYIHPSLYEGFGIMILEAFAAGVPVITSNISSLPEVVGTAGLIVDPKSPTEIAEAASKILDDPELSDDLRRRGAERLKRYSWAKMAEQTLDVYREVLKK